MLENVDVSDSLLHVAMPQQRTIHMHTRTSFRGEWCQNETTERGVEMEEPKVRSLETSNNLKYWFHLSSKALDGHLLKSAVAYLWDWSL